MPATPNGNSNNKKVGGFMQIKDKVVVVTGGDGW
jgi:hypothetical protein